MKKKQTDIIEDPIKQRKKMPQELKNKTNEIVFKNIVLGILIVLYFIFVNLGYHNITKNVFIVDIKVFSMCLIIITIMLFEKAYKTSKGELAILGIEILLVALSTLFMQYVYFYEDDTFIKMYMLIPVAYAIYYVAKSIVSVSKIERNYKKNISDVKEIIKKDTKTIIEEPTEDKDKEAIKKTSKKQSSKKTKTSKDTNKKIPTTKKEATTKKTVPKATSKTKSTTTKTNKKNKGAK